MRGIPLFKVFNDAQRVKIMVEPSSMTNEAAIQCALACMPEGRMPDVVDQRKGLRQVFVQAKRGRGGARYLGDLDGVGETTAKVVGGATGKHLRLPG